MVVTMIRSAHWSHVAALTVLAHACLNVRSVPAGIMLGTTALRTSQPIGDEWERPLRATPTRTPVIPVMFPEQPAQSLIPRR